ncbi:chlorophyll synthesis pathway protein BchC [Phaeobacter sp.]|uniref:chlorophyll synthesis pathway protein BchC n=1 Tax=Phaeobacter sp. TaxID=1902409 RepID=UPI0025E7CAD8|nr:chlorophyll synthesis pathway protein BchC [Phaeobacter sp.]
MQTTAVILNGPKDMQLAELQTRDPDDHDLVVDVRYSGISSGTEKLLWSGDMPPFPGMGYPLVPGYETAGEVVHAPAGSAFKTGDWVFVPGSDCFEDAHCLFGGAARHVVTAEDRVIRVDPGMGAETALLALAATARHAVAGLGHQVPDLIVGHGVLGRLLARLTLAAGAPAPTVWETAPERMGQDEPYPVLRPQDDPRHDYSVICDASGQADLLNSLIRRLVKGGEIVLAGFYAQPVSFAYPPAFMKEARLRIAAEWNRDDLEATRALVELGALSLDGLVSHQRRATAATDAYRQAFSDIDCLKMILDWEGHA